MTEKRFYYAHGVVWDTKKPNGLNGISINDLDNGLRVANWLNELNDENEQLKQFKEKVFKLIDDNIQIYEDTTTNDEFLQIQLDTKLQTLYNLRKELQE